MGWFGCANLFCCVVVFLRGKEIHLLVCDWFLLDIFQTSGGVVTGARLSEVLSWLLITDWVRFNAVQVRKLIWATSWKVTALKLERFYVHFFVWKKPLPRLRSSKLVLFVSLLCRIQSLIGPQSPSSVQRLPCRRNQSFLIKTLMHPVSEFPSIRKRSVCLILTMYFLWNIVGIRVWVDSSCVS